MAATDVNQKQLLQPGWHAPKIVTVLGLSLGLQIKVISLLGSYGCPNGNLDSAIMHEFTRVRV